MIKNTLIIKNITHENPGIIIELLDKYNLKYDMIDMSKNDDLPDINDYGLIIIMGGPDSANDKSDKISNEIEAIKYALKEQIPIFGICLGLQLMVKALGGVVYSNPIKEIGFKHNEDWYRIKLTNIGSRDPIFEGIDDNFIVFQLHGETVKLVEGIMLLGSGKYCKNQVIKIGDLNYGFQFHFEITVDLINCLIEEAPELKNQNLKQIQNDFEVIKDRFIKRGKKIFKNFLNLIKIL